MCINVLNLYDQWGAGDVKRRKEGREMLSAGADIVDGLLS